MLSVIAVIPLFTSVLRDSRRENLSRDNQNIEIAKQRLGELKLRIKSGEVDQNEASQIREEIESELLVDLQSIESKSIESQQPVSSKARKFTAAGIAVMIPLSAILTYLTVGEPGLFRESNLMSTRSQVAQNSLNTQSVEQNIATLEDRLATETEDPALWRGLADLYMEVRRFGDAARAYRETLKLMGDNANDLVRLADALMMSQDGDISGEPEALIAKALELDPVNLGALLIAGLAAAGNEDFQAAADFWMRAEAAVNEPRVKHEFRKLINEARAQLGQPPVFEEDLTQEFAKSSVRVQVSVDPAVVDQIGSGDTVFIFARAIEGPTIPLAAVKRQVQDLPLSLTLDDSMSMIPNMTISAFNEIVVIARTSKSGNPEDTSNVYFGESETINPGENPEVSVIISQKYKSES